MLRTILFLVAAVMLSACAGPRETTAPTEPGEMLPVPGVTMADFEDFDPSPYLDEATSTAEAVEHDVPAELMEGRADAGITSTVQGFRVQVFLSIDKEAAVQQEEALRDWWRNNREGAPESLSWETLPVYVRYIQPYYRVRIGNFTSREAAEQARAFFASEYPDAFIVQDAVSITR